MSDLCEGGADVMLLESLRRSIAARSARVDGRLATLTDRELALVTDAAVMGFVCGRQTSGASVPKDSAILRQVVDECMTFSALYPALGAEEPRR